MKKILLRSVDQTVENIQILAPEDVAPDGYELFDYVDGVNIGFVYQDGNFVDPNPPAPEPTPPDYNALRDEVAYGTGYPLIQAWYDGLPPRQRDPLQVAIADKNLAGITAALLPILPNDLPTIEELTNLLAEFDIPINLN